MDGNGDDLRWRKPLLALLDKIPALVWVTDRQLNCQILTGTALAEASNLLAPAKHQGQVLTVHKRALEGVGGKCEMAFGGRDLEAHVEPVRQADGKVTGVIGIALDVTERLVTETALRLSEQSYRSLVEGAPYGICRVTESGQFLQVNDAMLDMLGYDQRSEADLLMRDLPTIFETAEGFYECRKDALAGRTIQGLEANWIRSDGQTIQVRLGGRAIRNRAGEVLYLDLLAENITTRKELEARLGQAEKMQAIGQLAGGVAHDFNNLLTVIGGQIECVLEETRDEKVQRRLEDVKLAADRAAALTKQLLAFSRRQVLQSKVVDLNRLIDHAKRMLERLIREDITFTFSPGKSLGLVRTDPNQIEQVLMNLVVNAQDAMPQGGQLSIETGNAQISADENGPLEGIEPGAYVLMTVRDTGLGMSRETKSRIFEPFFTTKKTGEGTGLGLATVYGVVKQCGGHILVESHPGQGTAFTIYLPWVSEPEAARHEPAVSASPRGSETILVAEDEDAVRELMVLYLKSLGYHVLAAADGLAALEIAHKSTCRIDLLLTDLVLPGMGGRELAQTLGRLAAPMKVIFVSGYAGHGVAEKDLEFPDSCFVPKPFSMQHLAATIREVLDGTSRRVTRAGA